MLGAAVEENLTRSSTKKLLGLHHELDGMMEAQAELVRQGWDALDDVAAFNLRGLRLLTFTMDLVVIGFGGVLQSLKDGGLSTGEFFAFYLGAKALESLIVDITKSIQQFHKSVTSLMTMESIIRKREHPTSRIPHALSLNMDEQGRTKHPPPLRVELQNLRFSFQVGQHQTTIINNISLDIPAGSKVGIVGRSGAGKSTLIKLLCRLYIPEGGKILMGDKDLAETDIVNTVACVEQECKLFDGTVQENITIGTQATEADMIYAAKLAGLYDDIMAKKEGSMSPSTAVVSGVSGLLCWRTWAYRDVVFFLPICDCRLSIPGRIPRRASERRAAAAHDDRTRVGASDARAGAGRARLSPGP